MNELTDPTARYSALYCCAPADCIHASETEARVTKSTLSPDGVNGSWPAVATAMQQLSSVSVAARCRPNVHEPGIVSASDTILDIMSCSNGIATGQS